MTDPLANVPESREVNDAKFRVFEAEISMLAGSLRRLGCEKAAKQVDEAINAARMGEWRVCRRKLFRANREEIEWRRKRERS